MPARAAILLFALVSLATADTQPLPQGDLSTLLNNPPADAESTLKSLLGPDGANQLFYLPTHDEPATPATWGFKFEDVRFKSSDGTRLHGWFIPAPTHKPKGTVVFSHGNAGSVGHHLGFVAWLAEAGYNILMYDYRGFGKSDGIVGRRGMIDDVKAAFAYVAQRSDVDANRLISYGHSLGGAKSVTALAEARIKGIRAVVIDGAFASYQTMARVVGGQLGASLVTDELAPKDFIGKLSPVPLLVVHGSRDEVVPVSQGRELFENAREPKTLFEVKLGRHGDSLSRNAGQFRKRMLVWLDDALKG